MDPLRFLLARVMLNMVTLYTVAKQHVLLSFYTFYTVPTLRSSHSTVYHFPAMLFILPPRQTAGAGCYLQPIVSESSRPKVDCVCMATLKCSSCRWLLMPSLCQSG